MGLVAACGSCALGQSRSVDERLQRWFDDVWKLATQPETREPTYAEYGIEILPWMSESELRVAEERAARFPESQAASLVRQERDRKARGGQGVLKRVWRTNGLFRLSEDDPATRVNWDAAVGETNEWILGGGQLYLTNAGAKPAYGRDTSNLSVQANIESWYFATGGLSYWQTVKFETPHLNCSEGDTWTFAARGRLPNGIAVTVEGHGRFDEASGDATIDSHAGGPDSQPRAEVFRASDWQMNENISKPIALVIERTDSASRRLRYTCVTFRPAEASEVDKVSRAPRVGEPDPVRGELSIKEIDDRTGGEPRIIFVQNDGSAVTVRESTKDHPSRRVQALRENGWLLGVVSIGVVVVLWVWKQRQGR